MSDDNTHTTNEEVLNKIYILYGSMFECGDFDSLYYLVKDALQQKDQQWIQTIQECLPKSGLSFECCGSSEGIVRDGLLLCKTCNKNAIRLISADVYKNQFLSNLKSKGIDLKYEQ